MNLLIRKPFTQFLNIGAWQGLQGLINEAILKLNRNGRIPKPSNHGARPCSSVMRRARRK